MGKTDLVIRLKGFSLLAGSEPPGPCFRVQSYAQGVNQQTVNRYWIELLKRS